MDYIDAQGGITLQGKVEVQGSKNAALPILAATLLTGGTSVIHNCPRISDVYGMLSILKGLGVCILWKEDGVTVNTDSICPQKPGTEAVKGMRASLCLLGALLGRCGEVVMDYPGGCVIGARPIDLHISAFQKMGVNFIQEEGRLRATANCLHGADIKMEKSSVGATENIILGAVLAEGDTTISGAAKEPEIVALCDYLRACGAQITGDGTRLSGTEFVIPRDRIVAGTYLLACVGIGGSVLLERAPTEHMESVMNLCNRMGAILCETKEGLYVQSPEHPMAAGRIQTENYPGFPTDLQSVALAVATIADGETVITEQIFENRFRVVEELRKMGALIEKYDEHTCPRQGFLNGCEPGG